MRSRGGLTHRSGLNRFSTGRSGQSNSACIDQSKILNSRRYDNFIEIAGSSVKNFFHVSSLSPPFVIPTPFIRHPRSLSRHPCIPLFVIPAEAGIHGIGAIFWIPTFVGMTGWGLGMHSLP